MKSFFRFLSLAAMALAASWANTAHAQQIFRVDASAPLAGSNGLTWATAFPAIELALANANVGDSVWVAQGLYTPRSQTVPGDFRSVSFIIPSGVDLLGGFDGTEATLAQRAGLFDQTILSGEIGSPLPGDNAYHVLHMENNFFGNEIDGFVIRDGVATGSANPNGGAAHTFNSNSAWFKNVTFEQNMGKDGGALYSMLTNIYTSKCIFRGNTASRDGGAVCIRLAEHLSSHCQYFENAARRRGGALCIRNSAFLSELLNCVMDDNIALRRGGAIFVAAGSQINPTTTLPGGRLRITNCTIHGNGSLTREGGGLWANESALVPPQIIVNNTIFWDNRDATAATGDDQIGGVFGVAFCDVQGGYAGANNIDADPQFINANGDVFKLTPSSPCRNMASNGLLINDILDVDDDGNFFEQLDVDICFAVRVQQGIVDIGAAETFLGDAGGGKGGKVGDQ